MPPQTDYYVHICPDTGRAFVAQADVDNNIAEAFPRNAEETAAGNAENIATALTAQARQRPEERAADEWLRAPLVDWEAKADALKDSEAEPIYDYLDHVAVRAAMISEYLQQRRGGYCGDHRDHAHACKATLLVRRRVRKALGYTIPKAGEFTF